MDSTQSLVQINLYQSQIHPRQRGFVRESRAPGGAQCRAGRRATAGREVGRGERRAAGQVSRGRLILGWTVVALAGGRPGPVSVAVAGGLMAGASEAGMEQSPVRPASAGGRLGTPSRSRGAAVAAGGSAVSPAHMPTVQRPAARAPVSVFLILALVGRPRQSPPAPPRPRRGRSWHPQGHPACTNPGGGQSEGRWRLPCTGRPLFGTI